MYNRFDLTGKVAIVTGCNTGLGQGMAIGLAEAGADIVGVYRSDAGKTEELVRETGRKFFGVKADLSNVNVIDRIVNSSIDAFGKIDILVNNAGIIRRAEAVDFTEKDWDDVLGINLKTPFFLSQAVAKQFIKQATGGKIINIASMLSFQGGIRTASYTASKHGIMGITKLLANEWAKYNINVNAIAPGYMITNNTEAIRADERRNQEITARIPSDRWGNPEDLKGAVIFLASPASDYLQGHTLAVDGGWLSR